VTKAIGNLPRRLRCPQVFYGPMVANRAGRGLGPSMGWATWAKLDWVRLGSEITTFRGLG